MERDGKESREERVYFEIILFFFFFFLANSTSSSKCIRAMFI